MSPSIPLTEAGIGGLGPWELIIILVIIMIVFGAGKLPTIGNSLGEALRNFKKAVKEPTSIPPKDITDKKKSSHGTPDK